MVDVPSEEQFAEFSKNLKEKMERAEQLGLKDYQHISMMADMKLQGVGFFFPPDVDDEGNISKNKDSDKYHIAATDYTDILNMVDRTLWFNRMADMMIGLSTFISQQFIGMVDGEAEDIDMRNTIREKLKKEGKDYSDFAIASVLVMEATEFIVTNRANFSGFYERCLVHTEPAMISIGSIPTIANIMEGGYTDASGSVVDRNRIIDEIDNGVTDEDIVNFLKDIKVKGEEE